MDGGSPRGLGWTWGWCRTAAGARGRRWGELQLLGCTGSSAASSSSSAAVLCLRRAPDDGPGHETERGKGQVSEVTMVVAVEGQIGRGEQRHDGFVLDSNLGSGGEIAGQQPQRLRFRPPGGARVRVE